MYGRVKCLWLMAALLGGGLSGMAADRIGDIEFFGYKGIDLAKVRAALPVHTGDPYSDEVETRITEAVVKAIGKPPTERVGTVCCDESGRYLIFIGLPGESSKRFEYRAVGTGEEGFPAEAMDLFQRIEEATSAAVMKGGEDATEDDSQGYALVKDPTLRALQLKLREWAVPHEGKILRVLENSSVARRRQVASLALGYVKQSDEQMAALVRASRDPDDGVRNNATRALGVLVRSNPALGVKIQPDTFIAMLNSGVWSDRNKGAGLLDAMTTQRNPELLAKIRAGALDSLIEMARWRRAGHASSARFMLGRMAGIPEDRLTEMVWSGSPEAIVSAAEARSAIVAAYQRSLDALQRGDAEGAMQMDTDDWVSITVGQQPRTRQELEPFIRRDIASLKPPPGWSVTWKPDYERSGTTSGIQIYDLKLDGKNAVVLCLVGGTRIEVIDGVSHQVWRGSHVRDSWIETPAGWKRRMHEKLTVNERMTDGHQPLK
jgi:hypothetical protein